MAGCVSGLLARARVLIVLVLALTMAGSAEVSAAQFEGSVEETIGNYSGIQRAVMRSYYRSDTSVAQVYGFEAYLFEFDSEASASAALDMLDRDWEGDHAADAIDVGQLGAKTKAYSYPDEPGVEIDILAQQDSMVYAVTMLAYKRTEDSIAMTADIVRAMLDREPSAEAETFVEDGVSTGGLWNVFPPDIAAIVPGVAEDGDTIIPVPTPEATPDSDDDGAVLDYGQLPGIQRIVTRTYDGDSDAAEDPATAPDGVYGLIVAVASFDTREHADSALTAIGENLATAASDDSTLVLEPVEVAPLGDRALALAGTLEQDGAVAESILVVVQDGERLIILGAVGLRSEANTLDTVRAVAETMLAREPGTADEVFDESGLSSGGVWEIFPTVDDPALKGLEADFDEETYP